MPVSVDSQDSIVYKTVKTDCGRPEKNKKEETTLMELNRTQPDPLDSRVISRNPVPTSDIQGPFEDIEHTQKKKKEHKNNIFLSIL